MLNLDMRFSDEEQALLSSKKGDRLVALGYVPMVSGMAFGRIRLYFKSGALDIVSTMHDIDYDGDGKVDDDDAFLSVEVSADDLAEISEINGDEMRVEYNKVVERVIVAQDSVDSYTNGELDFKTAYPQAIIFDLGDEMFSIDKQSCNWMILTIKHGSSFDELVYDTSKDYEDMPDEAPEIHNEYKREYIEL